MTERLTLVLSGGNALGAYQGGAYEEMHRREIRPDRIVASSIGAINAALIAGNPPDRQTDQLRRFWSEAVQDNPFRPAFGDKRARAFPSIMFGSPNGFRPHYPGGLSLLPGTLGDTSLYDLAPLRETLARMVDFGRLNNGDIRLTVVTTDVLTGEEVHFDNADAPIGPDHLLASCGLLPFFPPMEIGDRLLGDGGLSANLPLRAALTEDPEGDHLCIAIDLFSPRGERPRTVGQAIDRQLDLLLGSQTRLTLDALRQIHELRQKLLPTGPESEGSETRPSSITVMLLGPGAALSDAGLQVLDYSRAALTARWEAGRLGMEQTLQSLNQRQPLSPGAFVVHEIDRNERSDSERRDGERRDGGNINPAPPS